jgi:hypothetical protein
MKVFEVDFGRLGLLLLPTALRAGGALVGLLGAGLAPLAGIHGSLLAYRVEAARALRYTGQTCYLRGMLNDLYDGAQRRIRVVEASEVLPLVFYREAEGLPVAVAREGAGSPLAAPREDAITQGSGGFAVQAPGALLENGPLVARLRASIDRYRLATRWYQLEAI